ncbi:MAG: M23 family metallopeptidase [Actinomycetota bacterium]
MRRALSLLASTVLLASSAAPSAAMERPGRFIGPVDGQITERFKMLPNPYAAGSHRGIDFGVPAGSPVRASGDGTIQFAGPVGNDGLFVTIRHDGGLETTYSYLSTVDATKGQEIRQGAMIGFSGEGHTGSGKPALHFGAKRDGKYIDPELLLMSFDDISDLIRMLPLRPAGAQTDGQPSTRGQR